MIDAAVAAKRRQIGVLKELQRPTLSHILMRGLKSEVALCSSGEPWPGDIPNHWAMKRIKDIAILRSGESHLFSETRYPPPEAISDLSDISQVLESMRIFGYWQDI